MRIKVSQLGLVRINIFRFTDYERIYSVLNIINYLHINITWVSDIALNSGSIALKAYALGSVLTVQEGDGLWEEAVPVPRCFFITILSLLFCLKTYTIYIYILCVIWKYDAILLATADKMCLGPDININTYYFSILSFTHFIHVLFLLFISSFVLFDKFF